MVSWQPDPGMDQATVFVDAEEQSTMYQVAGRVSLYKTILEEQGNLGDMLIRELCIAFHDRLIRGEE